jgi:addiction module HigA family antidote
MNGSIHAGEILLEEYQRPMGISQNAMARAMGVPPRAVNEIVLGKRSITPVMSIRMGAFSGSRMDFGTGSRWSAISGVWRTNVWRWWRKCGLRLR